MTDLDHYSKNLTGNRVETAAVVNRMRRYVNFAKAIFRKGATSGGRTFNVCFAVKKNKVLAIGVNDYARRVNDRRLKTNFKKFGEKTYNPGIHAEISAILKLGSDDCSDISFYNVRLTKTCHCANSQPCRNCLRMLEAVNYKHVYFYDNDMRICEL